MIERWGAQRASTVTYLTPVVGVLLGVLVLDERLQWNEPVGGVLVVLGILVAQRVLGRARAASAVVTPVTAAAGDPLAEPVARVGAAGTDLDHVRA